MSNQLKMAIVQAIERLRALRWSQRRIARELGIDRGTVSRYVQALEHDSKPAIPPTGDSASNAATFSGLPAPGSHSPNDNGSTDSAGDSNAAIVPAGSSCCSGTSSSGRPSQCDPHRELILAKLGEGLSAQRIWQDLVSEHGFTGGYDSVKRFARRLGRSSPAPFRRMECGPGEEAQVDFGAGSPIIGPDGKRRKTHVFRIVLSHSRKAYSEATFTQTTEDFLRALENAFAHFGGVPKTLVIDNLKAAVAHPDWFDPELTPKVQSFCRHYGTVILPTKPYMARHKGKVESSVKYVKNNALKGRSFASLEQENQFLLEWETSVADKRIHGTTKRQVAATFADERPVLLVLPLERFPCFHEGQRKVNRDGHVEVAKAYYSVPPEYLGRTVWVRWDNRLVRIFNHRFEQIAMHVRHERGRFSTHVEHVAAEKISGLERGAAYLLRKVRGIGPQAHQWAEAMLAARGIEGTRVLMGLVALDKKHASDALDQACEIALSHGAFRLRTIRKLIARRAAPQQALPFLAEHPIIRPLDDYGAVVARAMHRQPIILRMTPAADGKEGFLRHGGANECAAMHPIGNAHKKASLHGRQSEAHQRVIHPPRSGYPLSGCTSAEPDSVSPDSSSIASSFHQEI
jgi:transposase